MSDQRVMKICETCGSTDVSNDATAVWDPSEQDWIADDAHGGLLDTANCENCGEECDIKTRPMTKRELDDNPPATPRPQLYKLLQELVDFRKKEFDKGLEINGADTVGWLGDFRERVKAVLS